MAAEKTSLLPRGEMAYFYRPRWCDSPMRALRVEGGCSEWYALLTRHRGGAGEARA